MTEESRDYRPIIKIYNLRETTSLTTSKTEIESGLTMYQVVKVFIRFRHKHKELVIPHLCIKS